MKRSISTSLILMTIGLLSSTADASTIGSTQITASTTLGQYLGFSIDQISDGITADSPFNGYASGFGATSGLITLTLDQNYDLSSFSLWNDINISNEGVRTFSLGFFDEYGASIGATGVFSAVSQFDPQNYTFAQTFSGVKTVELNVLTSNLQIEIREVAFNGEASIIPSIPVPASAWLFISGLLGIVGIARRQVT